MEYIGLTIMRVILFVRIYLPFGTVKMLQTLNLRVVSSIKLDLVGTFKNPKYSFFRTF